MPIELKPHNQEAYGKVKEKLNTSNRVAVIHPTGTGKMYIALKMLEDNKEKRAIYVAPSNPILHDLKKNIFAEGMNMSDFPNLRRITYQKLKKLSDEEIGNLDFDIIVLDEFHHCGAPEWGRGVERLIDRNPNANILGLSATPIRYLDGLRDMSDELFDNNVASEMTIEEAIEQGILPEAIYVSSLYDYNPDNPELANMQEDISKMRDKGEREEAQELFNNLNKGLDENTRNLPQLLAEYMKNRSGKYIVFCRNIKDMQEKKKQARKMFGEVNPNITIRCVSSQIKANDRILTEFENDSDEGTLKLLYAVDMLNEGYHIRDLDGVVMMRPTFSPTVFTQQLGRALTIGGDRVPVILDLVNNFSTCKIIEDFAAKMKEYENRPNKKLSKENKKRKISIVDKTKEFREIANKITELSRGVRISLDEKIKIFQRFNATGEELTGDTVFEDYPIGQWAIQIRNQVNRNNKGKYTANFTEEQLEKLDALGILERQDTAIDKKIDILIQWKKKYPDAEVWKKNPKDVLRKYATNEEEYKAIISEYERVKRYYTYLRERRCDGKLTEEQIAKCKEGNIKGIFGYPTKVEELAKKTGQSLENIEYIIINYGTMANFIDLYRKGELPIAESSLAGSVIRNTVDIDLNPHSDGFDMLYCSIMCKDQNDNMLELYSSDEIRKIIDTLKPNERYVIEKRYGLLDDLPRTLNDISKEMKVTRERVRQIEGKALRKMQLTHTKRKFKVSIDDYTLYLMTDDEREMIEGLKDKLYDSDLILRNRLYNKPQQDGKNDEILRAFRFIKNMDQILENRAGQMLDRNGTLSEKSIGREPIVDLGMTTEDLGLSIGVCNVLKRKGINTLGDIIQYRATDLIRIRGLGESRLSEIIQKIGENGLELREETEAVHTQSENESEGEIEVPTHDTLPEKSIDRESIVDLNITVEELGLSLRAFNLLRRRDIYTLGDITKYSETDLIKVRGMGNTTLTEIIQKIGEYGLTLRDETEAHAYDATNQDEFAAKVVSHARRREELKTQEAQAAELEEQYEEQVSGDMHSLDDDSK